MFSASAARPRFGFPLSPGSEKPTKYVKGVGPAGGGGFTMASPGLRPTAPEAMLTRS